MRFSLFPQDEKFFDLFSQQADLILKTCQRFHALIEDYTDVATKVEEIHALERQGDQQLHNIAVRLAKTFVTPIDREDIYLLANHMDDIMDFIQGAAHRLITFKIEMAEILVACAEVLKEGIAKLPRFEDISELRNKMKELERRGDEINRRSIGELFDSCADLQGVLRLLKWREIFESSEDAVDRFEDAFDVLEGVIIKHT